MRYQDKIYGEVEITEPVLHDLMKCEAMQRLQGILQHGITGLIGLTKPITRYDHSMGTMILVRQLGGSLTEQIAALLHDVSHTAFSHVIDYVFDGHDSQTYHDVHKERFLAQTDVPALLAHHGYDWRIFLEEADYPLLEQPSPQLCADRLDYFLRDSVDLGLATTTEVEMALAHLCVYNGRIVTDSLEMAQWLAYTYMKADEASWANFREVGLYELTARAIRRGLAVGAVVEADIWEVDVHLWQKLQRSQDETVQQLIQLVSLDTQFVWDEACPSFWVSTKLRTIAPDVIIEGQLHNISHLDPAFHQARQTYLVRKEGKWPMRIVTDHKMPAAFI